MILTKAIQLFVIIRLQLLSEVSFHYYNFIFEQRSLLLDVNWVMFLAFELIVPLMVILLLIWQFLDILKFWLDKCYDWYVLIDSWYPSHLEINWVWRLYMSQAINM